MQSLSSHIEPQDALELDLIRVKLWLNQEDMEIEYYDLPNEIAKYLNDFVLIGELNPEITADLHSALKKLPAWKDSDLNNLSKEQRECVAAVYVRSKGRRLNLIFRMDVNANVY